MSAVSLRYLVVGLGKTGRSACRMLLEDGASIVAAYNRGRDIGADLGALLDLPPCGIPVQPVSTLRPQRGAADVALFFTTSSLQDLMGEALACLRAGIRVITIAEEAASPWLVSPELARVLDQEARASGSALLATGMNDVAMAQLPVSLAAMTRGVTRITSHTIASLDRLGAATLAGMGIGEPAAAHRTTDVVEPSAFTVSACVARSIADMIGAQLLRVDIGFEHVVADSDLTFPRLGLDVPTGYVSGVRETAIAYTVEGIEIEVGLVGKLFGAGDVEQLHAQVHGHPSLSMRVHPEGAIDGVDAGFAESTAAIALNRVPTLMMSPPGLITFDQLCAERYRVHPRG